MKIVSNLITNAFAHAFIQYPEEHEKWTRISHRIGAALPNSLISHSVQKAGNVDLLIKSMEDEFSPDQPETPDLTELMSFNYQCLMSDVWIGQIYAIFYAQDKAQVLSEEDNFRNIYHHLKILRVTLEKHQIANDRQLKTPLPMQKHPPKDKDTLYEYSGTDPKRAHHMPRGCSSRGSCMWHVIDIKNNNSSYWIERRQLAEKIFELYKNV